MIVSQGILMLLFTAAAGTAMGWWLAERRMEAQKNKAASREAALEHAAQNIDEDLESELAEPEVSPISTLVVLVLISLVAVGLGFLTWSSLSSGGKTGMSAAALPLVGLAGASLITALALGPILEAVFEPKRRELERLSREVTDGSSSAEPDDAEHNRPYSRAA